VPRQPVSVVSALISDFSGSILAGDPGHRRHWLVR
jgi:hypothetical protein